MPTYADKFKRIQERLQSELHEFNDMQSQDMERYGRSMMRSANDAAMAILKIANEGRKQGYRNNHEGGLKMREAEIVRTHKDTWFSVRMGDNMILCLSEEGHYPTCCVVSMSEERIVTPDTTGQIYKDGSGNTRGSRIK